MMNYKLLTFLLSVFLLASISADTIYDALGADNISSLFKDMEQRFAGIKNIPDKIGNLIGQKIIADNPRINEAAKTFKALQGGIGDVMFRPVAWKSGGTELASGSNDGTITIWNMAGDSPQSLQTLKASRDDVLSVAWSPDETKFFSVSRDAKAGSWYSAGLQNTTIDIWDTKTWQRIKAIDGAFISDLSIAWSPDSKRFAWASEHEKTLKIWNTESWELVKEFTGVALTSISWSPDGAKIAGEWHAIGIGRSGGFIRMWDTTSWQDIPLKSEPQEGTSQYMSWSPDGQLLAFSTYLGIRIFDVNSGNLIQNFQLETRGETFIAWSPNGEKLAFKDYDWEGPGRRLDCIFIADTTKWPRTPFKETYKKQLYKPYAFDVKISTERRSAFTFVEWNPNSSTLITSVVAAGGEKMKMWDAKTGDLIQAFDQQTGRIKASAWSLDGTKLSSVAYNGSIIIWNFYLLGTTDIKNITLEQALLLKLLYAKNIALRYQWIREKRTNPDAKLVDSIDLASVHDKLLGSEAQRILGTFSDDARDRIIKRYNIVGYTSSPKREIDEDVETSSAQRHHDDPAVHQGASAAAASSSGYAADEMDTN